MYILVAPDSFKGSLTAAQAGQVIEAAFKKEMPNVTVKIIPMADGGEGTIDTFLYAGNGNKVVVNATGPTGERVRTYYGVLQDNQTAVIEIANISGYTLVSENERDPFNLTTVGIAECMKHALDQGIRKFIVGLGGSATNDGGIGMLQGLGVVFKNKKQEKLEPYPSSLKNIHSVDYNGVDKRIWESEIQIASDVENPLCGTNGATYVFGPQKGVKSSHLESLDKQIKNFALRIEAHLGKVYHEIPGSGAAGGLGFALLTIGAKIESGAKLIAGKVNLDKEIKKCNLVITGEGKTDNQTLHGKLPYVIAKIASKYNVPTILISGTLDEDITPLYAVFHSMHSIVNGPVTLEYAMNHTKDLLCHKTRNIARLLKCHY